MRTLTLFLVALLCGCDNIPRDPEGTLERIRHDHVMHVGLANGATPRGTRLGGNLIAALIEDTQAKPTFSHGSLEPLLLDLEAGKLDLIVGARFADDTPWKTRVTLGPALSSEDGAVGRINDHAVTRNGENAWIMLVQRQAKALGAQ